MNPNEIIERCRVKGIILQTEGEQLRFSAPVGALMPDLRQLLTENKKALVYLLQAHTTRSGPPTPELAPDLAQSKIPLSFAQQRLWFLDQLEPGKAVYNISQTRRLMGKLNISALESAYTRVIDRQAVLRTSFHAHEEVPQQVIASMCTVELHIVDYSALLETERQEKVRSTLEQNSQYIFDLVHGPLIRTMLLRLSPSEHLLNVILHHIITDALSNGIFWHDLAQYYRAIVTETSPDLPSLPIQYADYAVWERVRVEGREGDRQRSYWKAVLHDAPRTVDLPTDHSRPPLQSYQGNTEAMCLSETLTTRIKAFNQQHHVTVFMTLLSVFNVWLFLMGRQADLVVGVPITNRRHQDLASVMGFFVNTIVLRTRLQPKHTFMEILEHVRTVCLNAYAHQDFPFEQTVKMIQPQRDLSRHPLFQIMFQVLPKSEPSVQWPDIEVTPFREVWRTARLDLSVTLRETDQGLDGTLTYSTDLFEPS
ncbi:MAG: non-ribosomal peptide synthetase, partial [Nitrospirales bacterium]